MGQQFSKGQKISSPSGTEYKIEEYINGGAQGDVYRVSSEGKDWALKWYHSAQATAEQRKSLEALVLKGAPTEKFLWPLEIVSSQNFNDFGYIMPLLPKNFKKLKDYVNREIDPSFFALATAGFQLSDSFFHLHAKGLAYRDISFGNIFFDPQNGDVLIIDNDNVTFDKTKTSLILGTMKFMAPEIVRGEALPSSDTDRFSLAILLFYMFFISHPLEGKKESAIHILDTPAMKKLYGDAPLYIFDPIDRSNEPDPNRHKNARLFWDIYPQFFKDLFMRSFTEGLKDSENGRVREGEWRSSLMRFRDSIMYCPKCGCENFYDSIAINNSNENLPQCWHCKTTMRFPVRIKIGNLVVMLNDNTKLYPYHLNPHSYDLSKPVAEMTQHPSDKNIWGLKNVSNTVWQIKKPDSTSNEVPPGKSVALVDALRINFGNIEGEMRT